MVRGIRGGPAARGAERVMRGEWWLLLFAAAVIVWDLLCLAGVL